MKQIDIFTALVWYDAFLGSQPHFSQMYPSAREMIDNLLEKYSKNFSMQVRQKLEDGFRETISEMIADLDLESQKWLEEASLAQVEENLKILGFKEKSFLNMIVEIYTLVFSDEDE